VGGGGIRGTLASLTLKDLASTPSHSHVCFWSTSHSHVETKKNRATNMENCWRENAVVGPKRTAQYDIRVWACQHSAQYTHSRPGFRIPKTLRGLAATAAPPAGRWSHCSPQPLLPPSSSSSSSSIRRPPLSYHSLISLSPWVTPEAQARV
jgi:hypothetical protein